MNIQKVGKRFCYAQRLGLYSASVLLVGSVFAGNVRAQSAPGPNNTEANRTPAAQACDQKDALTPQPNLQRAFPPVCATILPDLFGSRNILTENGIGFSLAFDGPVNFAYDLLGHQAKPQLYGGQNPTYATMTQLTVSYNLDRVGFSQGTQLLVQGTIGTSSDTAYIPHSFTNSEFAINQPLFNGDVELRYGLIPLIYNFYGFVLGGNAAGAASGITSVIPIEAGLGSTEGTPTFEVVLKYPENKAFYVNFAVSRSVLPGAAQADVNANPTGLKFLVPGTGPLLINEIGYGSADQPLWVRAGGIINFSPFTNYRTGGTSNNYDLYAAVTGRVFSSDDHGHGLYVDLKADNGSEDVNLFARDYTATLFYRGPFGLSLDTIAGGVGISYFGTGIRKLMATPDFAPTDTVSANISYVHNIYRGVFLSSSLTYTTNPATVFKKEPNALIGTLGVQLFL